MGTALAILLVATGAACDSEVRDADAAQPPESASPAGGGQAEGARVDSGAPLSEDTLTFGRFGRVVLYRRTEQPANVVLFISGDGGWNLGVIDMAHELSAMDALVVGIDIRRYLAALRSTTDACPYPAADFEALSQYVQKRLGFRRYAVPVLVGYSSGATLAYATLVQAPPNTFRGAISMGFCPDLPLARPLCKGSGLAQAALSKGRGYRFLPMTARPVAWTALQGTDDQTCFADSTQAFVQQTMGGRIVLLPKVGHGFGVERRWMPQFREAFSRIVNAPGADRTAQAPAVRDLPLVEVRGSGLSSAGRAAAVLPLSSALAVVLSGDGGWASIDRELGASLAARGVPVVGWNSLEYFWRGRTPEEAARDLERVLRYYQSAWGKDQVLLVGYSLGADVLPFMASRLPDDLRSRIQAVALLGASPTASFEFHLTDWLGGRDRDARSTAPEIARLRAALPGAHIVCFYGSDERESICPRLAAGTARAIALPGGHHFDGNYAALAERVLQAAR